MQTDQFWHEQQTLNGEALTQVCRIWGYVRAWFLQGDGVMPGWSVNMKGRRASTKGDRKDVIHGGRGQGKCLETKTEWNRKLWWTANIPNCEHPRAWRLEVTEQLEPEVSAKFQTERPPAERAENSKGCTVHFTGWCVWQGTQGRHCEEVTGWLWQRSQEADNL